MVCMLIGVKADVVSKGRILKIFKTKRFLQGQKFGASLTFRNLDEKQWTQPFDFKIAIDYPTTQMEFVIGSVSEIAPLKEIQVKALDFDALSEGFALFSVDSPKIGKVKEAGEVDLVQWGGAPLENRIAFRGVNIETEMDILTQYGFLFSAVSLVILVLEKLYWLIKSLVN